MKQVITFFTIILLTLTACRDLTKDTPAGKSIEMQYAEFLTMTENDSYITAEVLDPWHKGKVLHRYILVNKDTKLDTDTLPEGDVIRIPLTSTAVYSSVHCALMKELGAYNNIKGVCDADYINMQEIHQDIKSGKITDLGNSMTPNIEKIMDLTPDAILLSPFENSGSYGKLGSLNIPLIECADYMETSALGRAEWMRFYGILLGKREVADSIFAVTEEKYNALCEEVKQTKTRPTVFTELKSGSTWYVAGGNSYVGRLLKDAGADYIFKDVENSGSVPMSPEVVFDRCQDADFWLLKYNMAEDMGRKQLAEEWVRTPQIKAFAKKNVFGVNLSRKMFYEETPFHPDVLLSDYVFIFHPELQNGYKLKYYSRLVNDNVVIGKP